MEPRRVPEGTILTSRVAWRRSGACSPASATPLREDLGPSTPPPTAAATHRIENLCVPRSLPKHLEVAWGLGGIEVLHCVAYPWADVPAPIFAADLVAFGGRVTLCIADACPLAEDLSLPEPYVDAAERLKREMMARCPALEPRPLPEWGETILSRDACVCAGPPVEDFPEQAQARAFARYAEGLHDAYLDAVRDAATCAFATSEGEYGGSARERLAAQVRFCEKQLLNDKTGVLERAMGANDREVHDPGPVRRHGRPHVPAVRSEGEREGEGSRTRARTTERRDVDRDISRFVQLSNRPPRVPFGRRRDSPHSQDARARRQSKESNASIASTAAAEAQDRPSDGFVFAAPARTPPPRRRAPRRRREIFAAGSRVVLRARLARLRAGAPHHHRDGSRPTTRYPRRFVSRRRCRRRYRRERVRRASRRRLRDHRRRFPSAGATPCFPPSRCVRTLSMSSATRIRAASRPASVASSDRPRPGSAVAFAHRDGLRLRRRLEDDASFGTLARFTCASRSASDSAPWRALTLRLRLHLHRLFDPGQGDITDLVSKHSAPT